MSSYYLCLHEGCGMAFPTYNTLTGHYMGKHKGEKRPKKQECEVEELPEGYILAGGEPVPKTTIGEGEGVTPKTESVYKQMPEPSSVLFKVLSEYPGLPQEIVDAIMKWTEYKPGALHPMEVSHLLNQMAGVPKGAANIIPQQYQLAMQKAAQEGNADVQMALAGWSQMGQQQPGQFGAMFPMMGQSGGQYGQQPYIPPWGQPQMGYPQSQPYPNYPQFPYQPPRQEEPSRELTQLRELLETQQQQIAGLRNIIAESEEKKKEEALNARLGKIEESISALINRPATGEGERNKELEKLSDELKSMREERTSNQIASLENKISELKEQQSASLQDRIGQLEDKVKEYKGLAEKPIVGMTSTDGVVHLGDKALDKLGEFGRDVRAVWMAPHIKEQYSPQRKSAEERGKTGEKLAEKVEKEARIQSKGQNYISTEEVIS